jgi:benzoate/toluate 1,2-dioxygenase beta subunit
MATAEPLHQDSPAQDLLYRAVEDFLYREALLLDERRFDDWLELFATDGFYWIPATDLEPARGVSHAYDDHQTLTERISRLQHPRTWSQDPPSRTTRAVSNVIVTPGAEHLSVSSVFVLYALRKQHVLSFAGRYQHHLRVRDDSFEIAFKKVTLISFDQAQPNINFIW